jgi:hypothetical protein
MINKRRALVLIGPAGAFASAAWTWPRWHNNGGRLNPNFGTVRQST